MVRSLIRRSPALYDAWRRLRRWLPRSERVSERRLRNHARAARVSQPSFAGEAGHLDAVLRRCGINGGFVVDIAAGDGVTQSCTLHLFRDADWRGLAVELDPVRFRMLEHAYAQFAGARAVQARITPESVEALLAQNGVPRDFEVLNLDIDSWDLAVAEAILRSFRPAVITMEINEKIPPPVFFTVHYDSAHEWKEDHFYGCSLTAAAEVVRPAGYVLESLHYNNAFFVRRDLADGRIPDVAVAEAYERGYRTRPDRRELFPWNHDVEHWLRQEPAALVDELRRTFRSYDGRFTAVVRGLSNE